MAKARETLRLKRLVRTPVSVPPEEKKEEVQSTVVIQEEKPVEPLIPPPIQKEKPIEPQVSVPIEEVKPMQEPLLPSTSYLPIQEETPPPPRKNIKFADLFILPPKLDEEMEIITERPVPRSLPNFPISQYAKLKEERYNPPRSYDRQPSSYSNRPQQQNQSYSTPPSFSQGVKRNHPDYYEQEDEFEDEDEYESEEEEPVLKRPRIDPGFQQRPQQPVSQSQPVSPGIMQRLGGLADSIPAPVKSLATSYGPNVLVAVGSGVFLFVRAVLQKWSHQKALASMYACTPTQTNRVDPTTNQINHVPTPMMTSPHVPSVPQSGVDFSNF